MATKTVNKPLTPAVLHILLALSTQERHGYGIMKQVESESQGKVKMGPGTLYGSLGRMIDAGLNAKATRRLTRKWMTSAAFTTGSPGLDKRRSRPNWDDTGRSGGRPREAPFDQGIYLTLWQMTTLSPDIGTGVGNCSASIRGLTASASRRAWSKHSTTLP